MAKGQRYSTYILAPQNIGGLSCAAGSCTIRSSSAKIEDLAVSLAISPDRGKHGFAHQRFNDTTNQLISPEHRAGRYPSSSGRCCGPQSAVWLLCTSCFPLAAPLWVEIVALRMGALFSAWPPCLCDLATWPFLRVGRTENSRSQCVQPWTPALVSRRIDAT